MTVSVECVASRRGSSSGVEEMVVVVMLVVVIEMAARFSLLLLPNALEAGVLVLAMPFLFVFLELVV